MRCFDAVALVLVVASPGLPAAPAPPVVTSIESLTAPPDLQAQDVKLCMSSGDFQTGPGKDFALSLTLSTPASHVFVRDTEFQFLQHLLFGRIGAKVPLRALAQFSSGGRLGIIRLGFKASTEHDAIDVYDSLYDEVLHAYAIAQSGPIFPVEDKKHDRDYARYARLLLVDKYGDALILNLASDAVTLTYWARGVPGSPGANAAGVLLGRYPRFCEPVSEAPVSVPASP